MGRHSNLPKDEAMILSGDPERIMAGAVRAGILGNVLARVRTNQHKAMQGGPPCA